MADFIIGIDGGGTKTDICIHNLKTLEYSRLTTKELNVNGNARNIIAENIQDIIALLSSITHGINDIAAICIGCAGLSNPFVENFIRTCFTEAGYHGLFSISGDCQTGLAGALLGQPGCIIISGTGSICYGKSSDGREYRSGGYGYLFDDEGSGFSLGRSILGAVVKAMDGRGAQTILTDLLKSEHLLSTPEAIVEAVYQSATPKKTIAAFAPLLPIACNHGDSVSLAIAQQAAFQLSELTKPVIYHLELSSGQLALCGSIFRYYSHITSSFLSIMAQLYPDLSCGFPKEDASYGACLIANQLWQNKIVK